MAVTTNLDPSRVLLNIGGFNITGFADGTFLALKKNEKKFAYKVGAHGTFTRIKLNDNTTLLTCTLLQSGEGNTVLMGLYNTDVSTPSGVFYPVVVTNMASGESFSSPAGFVEQIPDTEYSASEVMNREWSIILPDCETILSGNPYFQG